MAETSIGRARRLAKEKREAREAADKAAESPEPEKVPEKRESSLLESIRKAFSSEDDIKRIDAAVDAVSKGVEDANTDHKRKK